MNVEFCPVGYSDPQAWCDWRNSEMTREDLRWIVGPNGTPMLTEDREWSARHAEQIARKNEEERKRHNWRMQHPIDDAMN